jgi:phospholipid/cholesterol/gamma-HCH transport system substrate-binding protein
METNVNYTIVGAFVILLTGFIIFAIIWLSSGLSSRDHYLIYEVFMTESVSGVNIDSVVEYNGVNVGTVKSIELDPRNPQIVSLLLKVKSETPITKGTVATLNVKGFTGIAYVALRDKGVDPTPLVATQGQLYPVIKTAPSFFLRLDTTVTKLSNSLRQLSDAMRKLLDEQNLYAIHTTLVNLREFTHALAGNSQQINAILRNTATASQQFGPLMQSTNATVSNFSTLGRDLSAVSSEIKQNPAVLIRGKAPRELGPGE